MSTVSTSPVAGPARLFAPFRGASDRPALRFGSERFLYGDLSRRARALVGTLQAAGIGAGDRIATLLAPSPAAIVTTLATYGIGATLVPINTRYRRAEIDHILTDSGAKLLIADGDLLESAELENPPPIIGSHAIHGLTPATTGLDVRPRADTPCLFIYTSGTTGPSKGVVHTFESVAQNMAALTDAWGFSDRDRLVLALPLFHVHGLCIGVHGAWLHGMEVDLLPAFSPAAVVEAIRTGGTVFMGVPTMYRRLLEHLEREPGDGQVLAGARLFTAGSAALPAPDFQAFERFTGHRILERYGMSETLITLSNPLDGPRLPGSVGGPVPGCEARVCDERGDPVPDGEPGELEVRSGGMMVGYWGNTDATRKSWRNGWFRTGDVAVRAGSGTYQIVGRLSVDIIKSGGFKISAREIEEVIAQMPGVHEVAVVGLPDPTWGERIVAAVVPSTKAEPPELAARVIAHTETNLAAYKKPRQVVCVESLPRNALGKLQKRRLIDALLAAPT